LRPEALTIREHLMLWSFLAGVAVGALLMFVLGFVLMIADSPADERALDRGIEGAGREHQ